MSALLEMHDVVKPFEEPTPWAERLVMRRWRRSLLAVDGVSLSIESGTTLGLVGESGCGKSTLARLAMGLHKPSQGRILFGGQALHGPVSARMQMIFQDPYSSLNPRWNVGEIVAEPLRAHRLIQGEPALKRRVGELLESVGLAASDMLKWPHQFSGGQRQRISIARALASRPEFLVCDEPTSSLDVSVQAQVLNIMKDRQRLEGLTYLFISHNLAVIRHMSDQVAVMYAGRLVEVADARTLFEHPLHPYTRMLLDSVPRMQPMVAATAIKGEPPDPFRPVAGCVFHPRCSYADDRCRTERPPLLSFKGIRIACHGVQEGRLP